MEDSLAMLEKLIDELDTQLKEASAPPVMNEFFGHDILKSKLCTACGTKEEQKVHKVQVASDIYRRVISPHCLSLSFIYRRFFESRWLDQRENRKVIDLRYVSRVGRRVQV